MFTSRGSHHIENIFACEMFTRKVEFTEFNFEKVFVVYFESSADIMFYDQCIVYILVCRLRTHIVTTNIQSICYTSIFIDNDYL